MKHLKEKKAKFVREGGQSSTPLKGNIRGNNPDIINLENIHKI